MTIESHLLSRLFSDFLSSLNRLLLFGFFLMLNWWLLFDRLLN
jgi:hypothetical protein